MKNLVYGRADENARLWLKQKLKLIEGSKHSRDFYLAFSTAPRIMGKQPLNISDREMADASKVKEGFNPVRWTIDQTCRVLLLVHYAGSGQLTDKILNNLFETAEVNEQVSLFTSLPLLPDPENYVHRAEEGVRTNISVVFEAIALRNPYPANFLSENSWNQMVLKAIFTERKLDDIYGLESRANASLARMLQHFAQERWAANRSVTPELWRSVGPFITEDMLVDIERLFQDDTAINQQAGAMACYQSLSENARKLLDRRPALRTQIEAGEITWQKIADTWHNNKSV